jgi:hypothetical protein
LWLLMRRQLFSAASPSLKIMVSAVLLEDIICAERWHRHTSFR